MFISTGNGVCDLGVDPRVARCGGHTHQARAHMRVLAQAVRVHLALKLRRVVVDVQKMHDKKRHGGHLWGSLQGTQERKPIIILAQKILYTRPHLCCGVVDFCTDNSILSKSTYGNNPCSNMKINVEHVVVRGIILIGFSSMFTKSKCVYANTLYRIYPYCFLWSFLNQFECGGCQGYGTSSLPIKHS